MEPVIDLGHSKGVCQRIERSRPAVRAAKDFDNACCIEEHFFGDRGRLTGFDLPELKIAVTRRVDSKQPAIEPT